MSALKTAGFLLISASGGFWRYNHSAGVLSEHVVVLVVGSKHRHRRSAVSPLCFLEFVIFGSTEGILKREISLRQSSHLCLFKAVQWGGGVGCITIYTGILQLNG